MNPSRGIVNGLILSAVLWIALFAACSGHRDGHSADTAIDGTNAHIDAPPALPKFRDIAGHLMWDGDRSAGWKCTVVINKWSGVRDAYVHVPEEWCEGMR